MKTINTFTATVKPLVSAVALAASIGSANAQPIVTVGGSLNASALVSTSSSIGALNTSKAFDAGYSGEATVSLPSRGGDPVQSIIDESQNGSDEGGSLPGLGDNTDALGGMEDSEGMGGRIEATVESTQQAAAEVTANAEEFSPESESSDSSQSEDKSEEDSTSDDEVADDSEGRDQLGELAAQAEQESRSTLEGSGNLMGGQIDAAAQASQRTAAELTASVEDPSEGSQAPEIEQPEEDSQEDSTPDDEVADDSDDDDRLGEVTAQAEQEVRSTLEGSANSMGGQFEAAAEASQRTAAELTANVDEPSESPEVALPEDESQGENPSDDVADDSNGSDQLGEVAAQAENTASGTAEGSGNQPSPDQGGNVDIAAAAESSSRADAFARF